MRLFQNQFWTLFFLLILGCGGQPADSSKNDEKKDQPSGNELLLRFGVYAADRPCDVFKQFRPILDLLEKNLKTDLGPTRIELDISPTYNAGQEALVKGKVDFARFGPVSYVLAKEDSPGISILAIETEAGKKLFHGVICVRKDSPIKTIGDLKGKSMAFGDRESTIGRLLAVKYLLDHGITEKDLSEYAYLQRHDKVGLAIAQGEFDAGALNDKTFNKLVKEGKNLKELVRFENVTKPWLARSGLDDRIKAALSKSLLAITDKKALEALQFDGFVVGSDEDFAVIRQANQETTKRFP